MAAATLSGAIASSSAASIFMIFLRARNIRVFTVLCGVVYPLAVTGIGQVAFPGGRVDPFAAGSAARSASRRLRAAALCPSPKAAVRMRTELTASSCV